MPDPRLLHRLAPVAARLRQLRRLKVLSAAWVAAAALYLGLVLSGALAGGIWLSLLLGLAVIGGGLMLPRRPNELDRAAAHVEGRFADLDATLVTAISQRPAANGRYGFLQQQVVSEALGHSRRNDWPAAVSSRRLWGWRLLHAAALAVFVCASQFAPLLTAATGGLLAARFAAAKEAAPASVVVEPGSVEIERGTSLLVMARFTGPLPSDVELVAVDDQAKSRRLALNRSLDDPVFGGRLAGIDGDLTYHVEYGDARSAEFRITTFEYPLLLQADADIVAPPYTGLGETHIADVRRVTLPEGASLTLTCRLNKPVASAVFEAADGTTIPLVPVATGDNDGVRVAATMQPSASQKLRLVLTDEAGRRNKEPPEFTIEVVPNARPDLALTFPARDVQASPLEELSLEAEAWDDFGLTEYGLVYRKPSGTEETLVLGSDAPRAEKIKLAHLLALESLKAQPRELVSYYFYADDLGPDGQPRRTFSDMFFAEVRYFDEEYRELPSQQQQQQMQQQAQQGAAAQAGKLVELQRQIVTATWNLMRAWTAERVAAAPGSYPTDAHAVAEAQDAVRGMVEQAQGNLEDELAVRAADEALAAIAVAYEQLSRARSVPSVEPLAPARDAAQSAYQSLLQMQERLHIVAQSRQPGSSSRQQAGQNLDRRLDQLELSRDRNRYEQERQAQTPQAQGAQEQLQVLNRLRELSRRQEDVNDRIRELADRRRDARTDEERAEVDRQLQRLQEEQQALLRDVEELQARTERPENRRRFAEANQQLSETRENVRRASEALREGQTSRALTSGTRAQRELEQLKDEFRRGVAGEFDDVVRQLQQDVRDLAAREREIGERIDPAADAPDRPTLRDARDRESVVNGLTAQQSRLTDVLDRAREIVQESEESEPLLSKRLYDALRNARTDQPEQALDIATQLLRRGFPRESSEAERQARTGIDRLEQGIDRASQSILGDELDALRRARSELDRLTNAIESELAQADPRSARPGPGGDRPDRSNPGDENGTSPSDAPSAESQPGSGIPSNTERAADASGQPSNRDAAATQPQTSGAGETPSESQAPGASTTGASTTGSGTTGSGNRQGSRAGESSAQTPGEPSTPQASSDSPGSPGALGRGQTGAPRQPGSSASPQPGRNPFAPFQSTPGSEGGNGGGGPGARPLTGEEFLGWSDGMREVEEMLGDPELRAEAAAIREQAREFRIELKRHSREPNWDLVRTSIYGRLIELQQRVDEEIAHRTPDADQAPIDRDPVPARYSDLVREYYERLGRGVPPGE